MAQNVTVLITLGNKSDLRITKENRLQVAQTVGLEYVEFIDIGPATHERLCELQGYLERLKCFTVPTKQAA